MEDINLERTAKTPRVHFSAENGELLIEGISIPEDTMEFYDPIMKWVNEYGKAPKKSTVLTLKLEYFNTSTSVILMNFFKALTDIENTKLLVNWYFESDDIEMEDVGKDYQKIIEAEFNLISVETF